METFLLAFVSQFVSLCSYRTYEEWKQQLVNTDYEGEIRVLTVPMRNGNFVTSAYFCVSIKVLTVPMRNGNEAIKRN